MEEERGQRVPHRFEPDLIAANRSRGEEQQWDADQAQKWLTKSGFKQTDAGWMCARPPLELLQPGEYLIMDQY